MYNTITILICKYIYLYLYIYAYIYIQIQNNIVAITVYTMSNRYNLQNEEGLHLLYKEF